MSTRWLVSVLLVPLMLPLGACGLFGGGKDTSEPPAELTAFEQTLRVRKIWSSKVGGSAERLRLGLRPASDGARIYAGAHDGQVVAFDAESGRKLWSVKTRLPLAAGPGVGNGLVAFGTTDGDLVALDAESGAERWRQAVGSEVLAAPAVAPNVIIMRSVDGRLRGFSSLDGSTLWTIEQNLPALTLRGNTAPRVAGATVISGFNNGRVGAYEVGSGDVVWELAIANPTGRSELERLVDVSTGLQVVGNDVYVVGYQGRAVGIDLNTGLVLWQQDMSSYAGLGADFNNVYVTNDVGAVIALDRRAGTPVWRQEALRLRDVTAPARFGNALVVGDFEGYLHWLDPSDGRFLARQRAGSDRITSAPLVVGQNVFVQADDGTVAAFTVVEDAA
jgi:outer membrane protein assembly factor BamB